MVVVVVVVAAAVVVVVVVVAAAAAVVVVVVSSGQNQRLQLAATATIKSLCCVEENLAHPSSEHGDGQHCFRM